MSVSLCLTNEAPVTTGALTGTLITAGGISVSSGPQSYGEIALGANVCRTFTFTVSATCGATATASLEIQESGGPTRMLTYPISVGVRVPVFTENFDGVLAPALPAGWTTDTLAGPGNPWITDDFNPFAFPSSPPNHAFVGNLEVISDSVLVSPTIAISPRSHRLTFQHYVYLDADSDQSIYYDGGVLEVSLNGGAFQDILAAGGSFLSGGYNATLESGLGNPLAGRQAWSDQPDGFDFITVAVDLPAAAEGQNVALRWRLGSDSQVASFGSALPAGQ